ncbi:GT2 family glycosyltransferase [Nocardioides cavernae]|uniref:4,4'-diaponeurosporenoate glycosyltransferase n=1 Tax=Nocardioides cavernae TaxID=1921566 RepID=A0A7Y9H6H0_9ACTN|nr:glycosyltransferase [Nocardioides cavernae]NYE38581.1 GT2 family glycosyltransferase [Nocardioides cavernae]
MTAAHDRTGAVAVVVPARDEEELLPRCLDALDVALAGLRETRPDVVARVFVVLDACTDGSPAVVRARPGVTALTTSDGCVGTARAAGVEAAAAWHAGCARAAAGGDGPWVACTDADSAVPPDWLTTQLDWADEGVRMVVGTVVPRPGDLSARALAGWHARHSSADGHEHVHGANLGLTLGAYRRAGGFPPLALHEDVVLVQAVRDAGERWVATGAIPVETSGRRAGRAVGGFAAYVEELGA